MTSFSFSFSFSFSLLVVVTASMASADQTPRSELTIGKLSERSNEVVVARVAAVHSESVLLRIERTLKGPARETACIPRTNGVSWNMEERVLVILPVRSRWSKVAVGTTSGPPADLEQLLRLVERRASLADLESPVSRVREDALIDLVEREEVGATRDERDALARVLTTHPSAALGALASRVLDRADLEAVRRALARRLEDERAPARETALAALGGGAEGEPALDALEAHLRANRSPAETKAALLALGRRGGGARLAAIEADRGLDAELRALVARLREEPFDD